MEELVGEDGVESPPDNMAEKMMAYFSEKPKPDPGRPLAIDDGRLFGTRDHLVWLFEGTWADVGGRLPWIRKSADILESLQVWNDPNGCMNQHYIAKTLLRPSSVPANPKWLATTRRRLGELNVALQNASDERDRCRQSVEKAERALSDQLSPADWTAVQDQIARRRHKLSHAEVEYEAARKRQEETQNLLLDGEATFAREEFVHFCRSNRYRLTPLNIANALAGLPYIGWRQSANRCKEKPAPGADGRSMQVFKTIERIVRSCVRRSDLVGHAEKWLKMQKGKKKSLGVSELQEKWYYLRWSMKTVTEASPRVQTRNLPFAIAREYWKRISRPSNVDLLFEDEERIVS
jgi:hypothetical protein